MPVIQLTSAVGVGRAAIWVNTDHIVSFSSQTGGGCQLKMTGSNSIIAVIEKPEVIAQRINEAGPSLAPARTAGPATS
jgi:hypothetical protein